MTLSLELTCTNSGLYFQKDKEMNKAFKGNEKETKIHSMNGHLFLPVQIWRKLYYRYTVFKNCPLMSTSLYSI